MTERPSHWTSRLVPGLAILALAGAADARAQSELQDVCSAVPECRLAAAAVQTVQPRIGATLWGGNPIPGTAGTLGLRIASSPRFSLGARLTGATATLPPIVDRSQSASATVLLTGVSLQSAVGLVHGFAPLPTVGGMFALDAFGRASIGRVPTGAGFRDPAVWGWSGGVRLGLLRESLTLPGASLTATYGRSSQVTFGDPAGTTDGYFRGAVSVLSAAAAVSRRIFGLRLAGGVEWARYAGAMELGYRGAPGSGPPTADAVMPRWSGFGSLTWSRLVYHAILEVGWQEPAALQGLPSDVDLDPSGLSASLAFRLTP